MCYSCQGLGTLREGETPRANCPWIRERSWIFSSETDTTFLSSSELSCWNTTNWDPFEGWLRKTHGLTTLSNSDLNRSNGLWVCCALEEHSENRGDKTMVFPVEFLVSCCGPFCYMTWSSEGMRKSCALFSQCKMNFSRADINSKLQRGFVLTLSCHNRLLNKTPCCHNAKPRLCRPFLRQNNGTTMRPALARATTSSGISSVVAQSKGP